MIRDHDRLKDEYLDEKEIAKDAPRPPSAFATDRLFTDNRGDFPFGGHRLSSLYRNSMDAALALIKRYFSASFSLKYSNSTHQRATTPGVAT